MFLLRYTSTYMEDYKDQSEVKTQSTASLLGIREHNVTYKNLYLLILLINSLVLKVKG